MQSYQRLVYGRQDDPRRKWKLIQEERWIEVTHVYRKRKRIKNNWTNSNQFVCDSNRETFWLWFQREAVAELIGKTDWSHSGVSQDGRRPWNTSLYIACIFIQNAEKRKKISIVCLDNKNNLLLVPQARTVRSEKGIVTNLGFTISVIVLALDPKSHVPGSWFIREKNGALNHYT